LHQRSRSLKRANPTRVGGAKSPVCRHILHDSGIARFESRFGTRSIQTSNWQQATLKYVRPDPYAADRVAGSLSPYPMTMFGWAQTLALSLPVRPPRYAPAALLPAPTEDSRRNESFVECASSCGDNRLWLLIRQFLRLRKAPVSPNDDVRRPGAMQQVLRTTLFLLSISLSGFSGMEIALRVKFCFPTPKTESRPQGWTITAGPNLKSGRFPQVASSGPH